MIAMPVVMPTRHCSGAPAPGLAVLTAAHNASPARTACSASCSCASGIAKQDERGIAEKVDDEPAVAIDRFRDAALKGGDRVAQVLKTDAVGAPRRSDQLAGHGGDLPAFGVGARAWRGISCGSIGGGAMVLASSVTTGAIKRYPRRGMVSIQRSPPGTSPRTLRNAAI